MSTSTGAKKTVLGGMALSAGLSVLGSYRADKGVSVVGPDGKERQKSSPDTMASNLRVVTAAILATSVLLALADPMPDIATGFVVLIVVSSILTPWASGSRVGFITSITRAIWPEGG